MKRIISFLLSTMLFFCSGLTVSFAQTLENRPYPSQYGKPFNGVPDSRDVSLYQVNMRSFSRNGDLKGVTARLDSIKALGINVIYLMPIYPVGTLKASGSPYAT